METKKPPRRRSLRVFYVILLGFCLTGVFAQVSKTSSPPSQSEGGFAARELNIFPTQVDRSNHVPLPEEGFRESFQKGAAPKVQRNVPNLSSVTKRTSVEGSMEASTIMTTRDVEDLSNPSSEARTVRPKRIALRDLPISPELFERIEADQKRLGAMAVQIFGGSDAPSAPQGSLVREIVSHMKGPWAHFLKSFQPGLMDDSRPIETLPVDESEKEKFLSNMNERISGPPRYSLDTSIPQLNFLLSFGHHGEVVIEIRGNGIENGEGVDFVIFENPFVYTDSQGEIHVYAETATVAVSESLDSESFVEFPCDVTAPPFIGCAGVTPVSYRQELSLLEVGGDHYDLSTIGVQRAKYIRIRDTGDNPSFAIGTEGFDLDAVALIHND